MDQQTKFLNLLGEVPENAGKSARKLGLSRAAVLFAHEDGGTFR